ncbi:MAG: CDP-diacylglycerol--serine O-phosphatidyltransferase [Calditrichaeota bacterium]|nr:MAG: CDP-diacylglycerol--serine O-phosphatidyltransferase [Calditrichota bacterium]
MIRISRSIVPNFFTVGNMLGGFLAMLYAIDKGDLIFASWMIVLAGFLDAIDGKVARITNSASKFGVEYDSLADVVSFGAAPSILIYEFYFKHLDNIGFLLSFFPLLFGSIRLARFNVQLSGYNKTHFRGLPIPAAAFTLVGYIMFMHYFFDDAVFPRGLLAVTVLVSLLMVSNVRYEVFPPLTFRGGISQKLLIVLLLMAGILLIIYPYAVLFPLMFLYIISGMAVSLFEISTRKQKKHKITSTE